MKVYVCISEAEGDGRQVFGVYSSLDRAQEQMRFELDGYLAQVGGSKYEPDIVWYPGGLGSWGWYDSGSSNGFYIYEEEVMS